MKTTITFDDFPADRIGTLAIVADILSVDKHGEPAASDGEMFDAIIAVLLYASLRVRRSEMGDVLGKLHAEAQNIGPSVTFG